MKISWYPNDICPVVAAIRRAFFWRLNMIKSLVFWLPSTSFNLTFFNFPENNNTTINNNNNSSSAEHESSSKDNGRDTEKDRSRGGDKEREKHPSSDHKANSTSPKRPTSRDFPPEREKNWNYPAGLDIMATGAFWQNYSGKFLSS